LINRLSLHLENEKRYYGKLTVICDRHVPLIELSGGSSIVIQRGYLCIKLSGHSLGALLCKAIEILGIPRGI